MLWFINKLLHDVFIHCYQAASVQLGVLHLVGAVRETQRGDAFWANGMPAENGNTNFVVIIVSDVDRQLAVIRPFFMRSEATCREPGLAGGNAQSSRSTRRRNRKLRSVCICTGFFTRRWRSGRTTALRYETGEANLVLLKCLSIKGELSVLLTNRFVHLFGCQEEQRAAGLSSGWPVLHEMGCG